MYQHREYQKDCIELPTGKVVCVGRNYLAHIEELNNEIPDEPLLFIKPSTALCSLNEPIYIPENQSCHHELEVALLVKQTITSDTEIQLGRDIFGVGVALDLTLRDKQTELKQNGCPWERAKAFDKSCPVSEFVALSEFPDLQDIPFSMSINDELRQEGNTSRMMFSCLELLNNIKQVFTLTPGDIVLTGTPEGVGPLHLEDRINLTLDKCLKIQTRVV